MKLASLISRLARRSGLSRQSKIQNPKSKISSPRRRPLFESLENRSLFAGLVFPTDPAFPQQWELHNTGQAGFADADLDAPEAWSVTAGSMRTVLAEIDDGVDYTHPEIYLNIWLNPGEIPPTISVSLVDTDNDGVISFRDLNNSQNASLVTNLNGNSYIDADDLLADPR